MIVATKTCRCCKIEKPVSAFGKDAYKRDGLNVYCRECHNAKSAAYRAANPEKEKARMVAYRVANPRKEKDLLMKPDQAVEEAYRAGYEDACKGMLEELADKLVARIMVARNGTEVQ